MKAYQIFLLLLCLMISSCSKRDVEEIYQEAKTAEEENNFHLALERYQEVVDKYIQTAYAESSMFQIALIYNNNLRDNEKAITAYQKFYQLFPESPNAPTAMFLSAFILNNELKNLDSAKVMYESFLNKYPEHELATSAKFELETLGKDPLQVITPEIAAEEKPLKMKSKKN